MQPLPHHFSVTAYAGVQGSVLTESSQAPALAVSPPLQAGGPGGSWSPEDLLLAAIADGLALSFRAVARAAQVAWQDFQVTVTAELDWQQQQVKFTRLNTKVIISVVAGQDKEELARLLRQAQQNCLVANCLKLDLGLQLVFTNSVDALDDLHLSLQ